LHAGTAQNARPFKYGGAPKKKKTTYTLHTLATGLVLDQSPNEI
jgi:hypothetical protein